MSFTQIQDEDEEGCFTDTDEFQDHLNRRCKTLLKQGEVEKKMHARWHIDDVRTVKEAHREILKRG